MSSPYLKTLFILFTFLILTGPLNANDFYGEKNGENDKTLPQKQSKKSSLLFSYGTNLSFFSGEEGGWRPSYSIGLTFNFPIYRNLSMTLPLSYIRINAAPKNVADRTYFGSDTVYKTLSDWEVSIVFFEVPVLLSYRFLNQKSYDFRYVLGFGLAFAVKDFSELKKFTRTDEILGIDYTSPVDYPNYKLHSDINITTGVRFHLGRFYLDLLYAFYPYDIKDIAPLNSISLKLGIGIPQM
ncbi:MAG: hypothetical protein D6830_07735 [Ignavibacteria bacterium]|nr:MAG: hypothetical protein D6830_07735 [Ignavibacteria bacterium]